MEDEKLSLHTTSEMPTGRRGLTSAEFEALKRRIAEPARQPTPAMQRAIATYKRLMAEVIED